MFVYQNQSDYKAFKNLFLQYPYNKPKDLYYQFIDLGIQKKQNSDVKKYIDGIKKSMLKDELQAYYFRKTGHLDSAEKIYRILFQNTKNIFYIKI